MRFGILVAVTGIAATLVGCASPVAEPRSAPQEASAEANIRARQLYAKGDYAAAQAQAQRAYATAASVEDEEGIANSLLNLSMVAQRLGQPQDARLAVGRILDGNGLRFSAKSRSEAALRGAVLASADGDRALSEQLLHQVEDICPGPCPLLGKVANLRAQLAIEEGRIPRALAFADSGLALSQGLQDAEEEANAQRLAGNALIHLGNTNAAALRLQAALLADKRLGLSRKIFRDLLLLGIAAQRNHQEELARGYWARARDVAHADHHVAGVQEVERLMGKPTATKTTEAMR
jgi:tetratricopeptide (TPR) repeat protein